MGLRAASLIVPILTVAVLTWMGLVSQQHARMVRRHKVAALGETLLTLQRDEVALEKLVESGVAEQGQFAAARAEALASAMHVSVQLQRALDDERDADRTLSRLYMAVHNATQRHNELTAQVQRTCTDHGRPAAAALVAARQDAMREEALLEAVAARFESVVAAATKAKEAALLLAASASRRAAATAVAPTRATAAAARPALNEDESVHAAVAPDIANDDDAALAALAAEAGGQHHHLDARVAVTGDAHDNGAAQTPTDLVAPTNATRRRRRRRRRPAITEAGHDSPPAAG